MTMTGQVMRRAMTLVGMMAVTVLLGGCGTTYHGKYVTAKAEREPSDEFQVGKAYVVWAIDHTDRHEVEADLYHFLVFNAKSGDLAREVFYRTRLIKGNRQYYLVEEGKMNAVTRSSFPTQLSYDGLKAELSTMLLNTAPVGAND